LANLLATEQVQLGDLVCIDWDKKNHCLSFVREGENLVLPPRKIETPAAARPSQAKSGKSVEAPNAVGAPDLPPRVVR